MDSSFCNDMLIRKMSSAVVLFAAFAVGGLSGCSTNTVKPVDESASAAKPEKTEIKVVQQQKGVSPRPVGKDKHHIEYDQKRRWYQQQWEQQQAEQEQNQQQRGQQLVLQQQRQQQQQWQAASRANVDYSERLSYAAIDRTRYHIRYDGRYMPISYPNGDVPANIGVCTDTVIRSYRRLGVDLQRLVHEDISRAFYSYPNLPKWGLQAPDPNIDHRRVHNLKIFFTRHGQRLPVTGNPADYRPGDLVTWDLGGGQEHIGIVVNQRSTADPRRYMIVHNIAEGDKMEDVLFTMPISGHYRYFPGQVSPSAQLASVSY